MYSITQQLQLIWKVIFLHHKTNSHWDIQFGISIYWADLSFAALKNPHMDVLEYI